MTIVSRAILAKELGISKVRITQYAKAGLPVRADDKLDRETALAWIAGNVDGPAGEKAAKILRGVAPRAKQRDETETAPPGFSAIGTTENSFDQGAIFALVEAFTHIRALASVAAHEAGASRAVAERTGNNAMVLFAASAEEFFKAHDVAPFSTGAKMPWPHPDLCDAINWAALGTREKAAKGKARTAG